MTAPTVVCGLDVSEEARGAVQLARRLAEALELRVILVHVTPAPSKAVVVPAPLSPPATPAMGDDGAEEVDLTPARRLLEHVAVQERLDDPDLRAEIGNPAEWLLQIAEEEAAQLIVVGSRRRGVLASIFLGSVSATVAARASCPVVILPAGARVPS